MPSITVNLMVVAAQCKGFEDLPMRRAWLENRRGNINAGHLTMNKRGKTEGKAANCDHQRKESDKRQGEERKEAGCQL